MKKIANRNELAEGGKKINTIGYNDSELVFKIQT